MKALIAVALFIYSMSSSAADFDPKSADTNIGRKVADDLEVETLPNGATVTRLVSNSGLSAREFWVNSVYGSRDAIVIFQGNDGSSHRRAEHGRENAMERKSDEIGALQAMRFEVYVSAEK